MLCRKGFVFSIDSVPKDVFEKIKKELTVVPNFNTEFGQFPKPFPCYVINKDKTRMAIPRFFAPKYFTPKPDSENFGVIETRPNMVFTGVLNKTLKQDIAVDLALKELRGVGGGVLSLAAGYGKCLGIDTQILMYDGTIKKVQDIIVEDVIMGDDSTPRNILSLARGQEEMFRVNGIKGDAYTVNKSHILSLHNTIFLKESDITFYVVWFDIYEKAMKNKSYPKSRFTKEAVEEVVSQIKKEHTIVDISVETYQSLTKDGRKMLKGYKVPISFPNVEVSLDPYMFGYWLGDGTSSGTGISSQNHKVLVYFEKKLREIDCMLSYSSQYDYYITKIGRKGSNTFLRELNKYNLLNNKHIPHDYKCNSREVRLQVLAGLLDSDGFLNKGCFDFIQKNETLFDDVIYLARSLGFSCSKVACLKGCWYKGVYKENTYFRATIYGNGVEEIPTKIERKMAQPRQQKKDNLKYGITVTSQGQGDYYGFEIDGNHRFVLGDFTVTHNTVCAIKIACELKVKTLVLVNKEFLMNQWIERIQQFCHGAAIGKIQGMTVDVEDKDFVVGTVQSIAMKEYDPKVFAGINMLVCDESHHFCAQVFSKALFTITCKYVLGLSATPERKDGLTKVLDWLLGRVFFKVERTASKTTSVETIWYDHPQFNLAPPVNRLGNIAMAEVVTIVSELEERNAMIVELVKGYLAKGRCILILSERRQQCIDLQAALGDDVSALYIGGMKQEILKKAEDAHVLVSTFSMTKEGFDDPKRDTLIFAASQSDVNQSTGRIMRMTAGKLNDPLVVDIVDRWCIFFAQYKKRCAFYRKSGFTMIKSKPDTSEAESSTPTQYAFLD